MNHKNTAIAAIVIALALTAVAFTIPTRETLAWGFFGGKTKVDQRINQLNNCTNSRPDNTYRQSSYEPGTNNKPSPHNQGNTNTYYQTSTNNHGNTKNQVSSEDGTDNKQSSNSAGNYQSENKLLVLCVNKATNLAQIG
jgi:hypothetical protein